MCGLTSVLSTKLAAEGISCNIVAGEAMKLSLLCNSLDRMVGPYAFIATLQF